MKFHAWVDAILFLTETAGTSPRGSLIRRHGVVIDYRPLRSLRDLALLSSAARRQCGRLVFMGKMFFTK